MNQNNPFSLNDKHILITGASSGIGRAVAIECSKMRASVIILGRNKSRLAETFSQLSGENHHSITLDLNDTSRLSNLLSSLESIEGLVHCAGFVKTCPAKFINKEDYNEIFDTNLLAPMMLNKLLLEKKKISKGSSIVFISSIEGNVVATKGNAIYSASKGALSAYAKVLALELFKRRIRVNCILPAMVKTEMLESISVEEVDLAIEEKRYPLGYGEPKDVAWAVVYLLSDASRWVTGSNLILDGGLTLI